MTEVRELIRFLGSCGPERLPPQTVASAKNCLLDWFGVALAASQRRAFTGPVLAVLEDLGGSPLASVIGTGARTSVSSAAFANGTIAHSLDFDDVFFAARELPIHASAVVAPAVAAVAEWRGSSGRETLLAFVLGVECSGRLARCLGDRHYAAGWHATSTVGTVGAAIAAGRLLGLDESALIGAASFAASRASGLRGSFATAAKAVQVGRAASNGIFAATLARHGLGAGMDVLSGTHGFLDVFGPPARLEALVEDLGERFAVDGVTFKRHASCGATHAAIDAVLEMSDRPLIADIAWVVVSVPPLSARMAHIREPATSLEAKFSISHCTALAFAVEAVETARFADDVVMRPDVVALRGRITVVEDESAWGASVEVCTRDGTRRRVVPDRAAGIRRLARRHEFVDEKFAALVAPVLSSQRALELRETVRSFEDLADVSGTIRAFGAAGAAAREPVAADAAPAGPARRRGGRRGDEGGRSCSAR